MKISKKQIIVIILGVIITALFFSTRCEFFTKYIESQGYTSFDLGAYLGFLSLILAIYFAFDNYRFIDRSKKESNAINTTMRKNIDEVKIQSKDNFVKIENVRQNIFTKDTQNFPNNITDISDFMKDCCVKSQFPNMQVAFEIYTDVPGYGIVSKNKFWHNYLEAIRMVCQSMPLNWHFYMEEKIEESRVNQYKKWEEGKDKEGLEKYIRECKENVNPQDSKNFQCTDGKCYYDDKSSIDKSVCTNKHGECYFIKTIEISNSPVETHKSLIENTRKLQNSLKNTMEELKHYNGLHIENISKELPFFGWFLMDITQNGKPKPLKAIISYTTYDENSKDFEVGFYTEKEKLLHVLYTILKEHVKKYEVKEVNTNIVKNTEL